MNLDRFHDLADSLDAQAIAHLLRPGEQAVAVALALAADRLRTLIEETDPPTRDSEATRDS